MSRPWQETAIYADLQEDARMKREAAEFRAARIDSLLRQGLPTAVIQERMDASEDEVRQRTKALGIAPPRLNDWLETEGA